MYRGSFPLNTCGRKEPGSTAWSEASSGKPVLLRLTGSQMWKGITRALRVHVDWRGYRRPCPHPKPKAGVGVAHDMATTYCQVYVSLILIAKAQTLGRPIIPILFKNLAHINNCSFIHPNSLNRGLIECAITGSQRWHLPVSLYGSWFVLLQTACIKDKTAKRRLERKKVVSGNCNPSSVTYLSPQLLLSLHGYLSGLWLHPPPHTYG